MTYRIRTVSEMTGIPRNTLIAWERRYGIVRPVRHPNGYRSYSEEDVAQLLRIKNAQKAGLKVSEAFSLLEEEEPDAAAPRQAPADTSTGLELNLDLVREELLESLLAYRKDDAERLLLAVQRIPFSTRVHDLYFPVLSEIGERWSNGQVSVVQEHYASTLLRSHLASTFVAIGPSSRRAPHAACTTFPGDLHEISALALSIQLSLSGYRVTYLGPNLPVAELLEFVGSQQPRLVCVSVINEVRAPEVEAYAKAVAGALSPEGKLLLGGRALDGLTLKEVPQTILRADWWSSSSL